MRSAYETVTEMSSIWLGAAAKPIVGIVSPIVASMAIVWVVSFRQISLLSTVLNTVSVLMIHFLGEGVTLTTLIFS